jgi:putative endonuclease
MLVHYEEYQYIDDAVVREKQLKKWNREWKIRLIETNNPEWNDLSPTFTRPLIDSRLDRE